MKKLLAVSALGLFVGLTALSGVAQSGRQDGGSNSGLQDQLVGAWRLVWLEQQGAGGKVHQVGCCGMLVFTRDGHMSVQVMEDTPQAQGPAGPEQYSVGGYEASYGRYEVDVAARTFTFHVEGALVRTLIGKDLPRAYEFSGKRLIVKSTRQDEVWRVAWEHY